MPARLPDDAAQGRKPQSRGGSGSGGRSNSAPARHIAGYRSCSGFSGALQPALRAPAAVGRTSPTATASSRRRTTVTPPVSGRRRPSAAGTTSLLGKPGSASGFSATAPAPGTRQPRRDDAPAGGAPLGPSAFQHVAPQRPPSAGPGVTRIADNRSASPKVGKAEAANRECQPHESKCLFYVALPVEDSGVPPAPLRLQLTETLPMSRVCARVRRRLCDAGLPADEVQLYWDGAVVSPSATPAELMMPVAGASGDFCVLQAVLPKPQQTGTTSRSDAKESDKLLADLAEEKAKAASQAARSAEEMTALRRWSDTMESRLAAAEHGLQCAKDAQAAAEHRHAALIDEKNVQIRLLTEELALARQALNQLRDDDAAARRAAESGGTVRPQTSSDDGGSISAVGSSPARGRPAVKSASKGWQPKALLRPLAGTEPSKEAVYSPPCWQPSDSPTQSDASTGPQSLDGDTAVPCGMRQRYEVW
eukprot:TRINITY_DN17272_c0_g1_i1.p1 TRINITY_DN17272_c0_g1~~TRINITY_DN17272_c0_g1_i1.p1  ORF type:complete len:494 (+),score=98.95 TRINITY_DN17272_c0_g1_i1:49-1482(+)